MKMSCGDWEGNGNEFSSSTHMRWCIHIYTTVYIHTDTVNSFHKNTRLVENNKNAIMSHAKKPARLTLFAFPGV